MNNKEDKMESLHTVTGKFNDALFARMQQWLKLNNMSANQLLAKAVDLYISEPQTLEPVESTDEQVFKSYEKMVEKHKRALDELK